MGIADDGKIAEYVRGPRVGKTFRDAQHDDVIECPDGPGGTHALPFRTGGDEHDLPPAPGPRPAHWATPCMEASRRASSCA